MTGIEPVHYLLHLHKPLGGMEPFGERAAMFDDAFERLSGYSQQSSKSSYTLHDDGLISFEQNLVLTNTMANAAILVMYQQFAALTSSSSTTDATFGEVALERCLAASDRIINTISVVGDSDIELLGPHLTSYLFIATRFMLVYSRARHSPRQPKFDVLMHAINMCGRRWPLARRLDHLLRATILQLDSSIQPAVPAVLFDLHQSSLDIDDALRNWVHSDHVPLSLGLNGPYV